MKKIFYLIIILVIANGQFSITNAQAPNAIPYQGVARNSAGNILASQPIKLRILIHDVVPTGTVVYSETHAVTTTTLGLFNVNIGQGAIISGTLAGVNWGAGAKFMQVKLDPAPPSTYIDMGTTQLNSVPYALYAEKGNIPAGTTVGQMLYWNGSAWVAIPPGAPGQALTYGSNGPVWQTKGSATCATESVSNILATSATCGGIVFGSANPITARGVCWSTSPNPTTANSKTIDGTGYGAFVSNIAGLTANTIYYVRAYATSIAGTVYGNEITFPQLAIGYNYQGGKIAYILQPGDPGYDANIQHGLIAAASDQSSGAYWGCNGTLITGADGTALGTGNQNTIDIMAGCSTAGIAARRCGDLVLGGYSDWYLPGKDELNKLYLNRVAIGVFANNFYWSSTEYNNDNAWYQNFSNGSQLNSNKGNSNVVRAVRAF